MNRPLGARSSQAHQHGSGHDHPDHLDPQALPHSGTLAGVPLTEDMSEVSARFYNADLAGSPPRAIAALVPAAVTTFVLALVPAVHVVSGFSWFFGAGLAALFYFFLADRTRLSRDVSGEPIAVPSVY